MNSLADFTFTAHSHATSECEVGDLDIDDLACCGASPVAIVALRSRIHPSHRTSRIIILMLNVMQRTTFERSAEDGGRSGSIFNGCVSKPERHPFSFPLLPNQTHPSIPLRNLESGKDPACLAPAVTRQTELYIAAIHAASPNPRNVNFVRQLEVYPRT
jgi:hypothetical protein